LADVKKKIQVLEDKGTGSAQEDLKKAQDRVKKAELAIADAEERLSRAQERAVTAEKSAEIALKEGVTAASEAQKRFEEEQEAKRQTEARAREADEKSKQEVEEKHKREAEERNKREAEEKKGREVDEKSKKEVEDVKPAIPTLKVEESTPVPKPASPKPARKGRPMDVGVLTFTDIDAIRDNIAAIQTATNHFGWLSVGYVAQTKISLQATGYKSVEELADNLRDDQIQYALLRVGVDFDRDQKVTKTRDILIVWYGPKVKMLEKGQKTSHFGDIKKVIKPFHSELSVTGKSNFNKETIIERSSPGSGSHSID